MAMSPAIASFNLNDSKINHKMKALIVCIYGLIQLSGHAPETMYMRYAPTSYVNM